jgi:hypothetical protein
VATSKVFEAYIPGLNVLLRDLRGLDKESQGKLRTASQDIATRYMVPAWRAAAQQAGPWGPTIAASVRAKRDRLPAISIGGNRKAFSGGASATMVRYPAHAGRVRDSIPAAFVRTGWMDNVLPAYIGPAMREWGEAVDKVVDDFNRGPDL